MNYSDKAAVFILLGQSNAVGHAIPMKDEDKIIKPLTNVFGLSRTLNQSFDNDKLYWTGYTSADMNLAEEQDDTYSLANLLARKWQDEIDSGKMLPDLYILHIAIGAQGITEKYMWYPDRPKKLVPGKLGTVDISLYPYTLHFLSLIKDSINEMGKSIVATQLHWRGGEEDSGASWEAVSNLKGIYDGAFDGFYKAFGEKMPIVMHKAIAYDRCMDFDKSGEHLKKKIYINSLFEELCHKNENITMFDVQNVPFYNPCIRGNGIYIEDVVHYTPETNMWVAGEIFKSYKKDMETKAAIEDTKKGMYEHYKGNRYELIDIANHSETLEKMVVYRALYGKKELWVRPLSMWNEEVTVGDKKVKRFTFVEE